MLGKTLNYEGIKLLISIMSQRRKTDSARKRDERSIRKAHQTKRRNREVFSSYLDEDQNYAGFANQLATLGLKLRDIPGDGNCLFRSLGDQLDGHNRRHHFHRSETVKYMLANRNDFEPFVEDDCSFSDHIRKLALDGTYAGNDSIVAFARNNGVNVVIHQLNAPMWTISGMEGGRGVPTRQLHIAYHNGDHYSSVRKLNDNTETPANIKLASKSESGKPSSGGGKEKGKKKQMSPKLRRQAEQVMNITGCQDTKLILGSLEDCCYDIDTTVGMVLQIMHLSSDGSGEEDLSDKSSRRHSRSPEITAPSSGKKKSLSRNHIHAEERKSAATDNTVQMEKKLNKTGQKRLTNRQRKEHARKERKKRSADEKRARNSAATSGQNNSDDSDESTIVVTNIELLKI